MRFLVIAVNGVVVAEVARALQVPPFGAAWWLFVLGAHLLIAINVAVAKVTAQ